MPACEAVAETIEHSGEEAVRKTIIEAAAPFRRPDGSYSFQNRFRYLIAHAQVAAHERLLSRAGVAPVLAQSDSAVAANIAACHGLVRRSVRSFRTARLRTSIRAAGVVYRSTMHRTSATRSLASTR